jgi:hypothetical protein
MHEAGLPLAADHARLQQAVGDDAVQALEGVVPAVLGAQPRDDRELARRERRERGDGDEEKDGDAEWAQGTDASSRGGAGAVSTTGILRGVQLRRPCACPRAAG